MINVYIGFPIHNHPTAHFMGSFIRLVAESDKDLVFGFDFKINVSNLAAERCIIAHEALKMESDVLLFIDDDISFEPKTAVSLIRSACEMRAVVAATYRKKLADRVEHVGIPLEQMGLTAKKHGTLRGMAAVGMGMTAIHMSVIRQVIHSSKESLPFFESRKFPGEQIAGLFEFRVDTDLGGKSRFLGEDEAFCKRVIRSGGEVWMDEAFTVGHVGQFVYK